MKLIVKQDKFAKALSSVNRIATYRKDFPIVSNIFIKAQGNRLILTATNIELSIKIEIPAKIETEGEVLVPPKLLNSFVLYLNAILQLNLKMEDLRFIQINTVQYLIAFQLTIIQQFLK